MKLSTIYDQGSSAYHEDGLVVTTNIFGVFDGVTSPYSPRYPMRKFDGLSGGEMVARFCEYNLCLLPKAQYLRFIVQQLNSLLSWAHLENSSGLRLANDAGTLPGATLALARIAGQEIEIIQAGDCMTVVELTNGQIVVSPNQVRLHDTEMKAEIERIQREVAQEMFDLQLEDVQEEKRDQVRGEMWDRFLPMLLEARRRDVNQRGNPRGYGLLNGQLGFLNMVWEQTFPIDEVTSVLLFSDGIVPWTVMKSATDIEVGRTILEGFKEYGLAGVLTDSRRVEESFAKTSYINQAEATAVALVF